MASIPAELHDFYRERGARDRLRLAQRWYGSPFAAVEPFVPEDGTIVDAGCGFGLFSALLALAETERTVVGIDIDARKVERGRAIFRRVPNLRLTIGDLATAEFPPCSCVVLYDVLHHLRDTTVDRVIALAHARLKPGGVLIVKENDTGPLWKRAVAEAHESVAVFGGITASDPWRFRTRDAWSRVIVGAGFEVRHAQSLACHGYGRMWPHSLFIGVK